ncbi:DUF262 domain-containing protein [Dietzia natronolimnaea]|uniref:DUF262 domain-containing protein n=1 Tax=Dietzia natronolimnaea TaxID=161920 RepID=UPI003D0BD69B
MDYEGCDLDASTYALGTILSLERRYLIPTFQRDYEWTRDGQWILLFEDLTSAADRLLEFQHLISTGFGGSAQEKDLAPHFLGAIVCGNLPFRGGEIAPRSVIDGQQRLTTLQLLARGILDVLSERKAKQAERIRRMLFNPEDSVAQDEEKYKLWPRRRDREVWPVVMGDVVPAGVTSDSHLYLQARQYFAEAAREYISTSGFVDSATDDDRVDAISGALSRLFKIVIIDLDDNDDAQVIFEVLNGRQTPLAAIDLVKNLLFLRGELDNDNVDFLYDKYWAQFDDPWWKETVGRGHATRGRRDVLLSVWLTIATCTEANVGHLYREARAYLNRGSRTEDVLKELDVLAMAYQEIYGTKPVANPVIVQAYKRIRDLDVITAVPLLAWLRTLAVDQLSAADHELAVRAVESWTARRTYTKWQTRGYGQHFARAVRAGKDALENGDWVPGAIIDSLDSGTLRWPSDADVEYAFLQNRFHGSGGHSQPRIRLLLSAIDKRLRDEDRMQPFSTITYSSLEIEHVMPVKWVDNWPYLDNSGSLVSAGDTNWDAVKNERDRVVHRIGNLTLVTGAFNKNVSNSGWATIKAEFAKQRTLLINDDVAQAVQWDEKQIVKRATALAKVASEIWPSKSSLLNSQ